MLGTGPSNPLGYCLLECFQGGVQAFFDYQNGLGGVNGRELVISRVDDDEVGNTQVKSLELIGDDSIFGIFGAPLQYAGWADIGAAGVPLYTTFPASGDANGFDNIYIPNGTLCVECATPAAVQAAVIAGGDEGGIDRLRRVAGIEGLRQPHRVGLRHVRARRRRRVRLQERRPAVRLHRTGSGPR